MAAEPTFVFQGDDDPDFLSAVDAAEADGLRRLSSGHEQQASSSSGAVAAPGGRARKLPPAELSGSASSSHDAFEREVSSKRLRQETSREGDYMAALRGTHSETWQAMTSKIGDMKARGGYGNPHVFPGVPTGRNAAGGYDGAAAGDGCFHCGKEGHWAKDCPSRSSSSSVGGFPSADNGPPVPERSCPCGAGACKVLMANTEKNAGRQFYRCPLRKEEGQCGFFEWCDQGAVGVSSRPVDMPCPCGAGPCSILTAKTEKNMGRQFYRCPLNQGEGACGFFKWCDEASLVPTSPACGSRVGGRAVPVLKEEWFDGSLSSSQQFARGSSQPSDLSCPCGAGPCSILTAKTEKNMGRQFYKCPRNQGEGACGFFKWCDEVTLASTDSICVSNSGRTGVPSSNVGGGQCFKCQMDGHWAKDCPSGHSVSYVSKGPAQVSTGFGNKVGYSPTGNVASVTCYKCGQSGHVSRDCPSQQYNTGYGARNIPGTAAGGSSYTRGGESHWTSNYPPQSTRCANTGRGVGSGGCYKCGGQGHWANECRADGKDRRMR